MLSYQLYPLSFAQNRAGSSPPPPKQEVRADLPALGDFYEFTMKKKELGIFGRKCCFKIYCI